MSHMPDSAIPTRNVDVVVIGAGPAGLMCAAGLRERESADVVLLDREPQPGGLPAQCEHRGFGLWQFKRLMRGVDFAARLIRRAERARVNIQTNTTVLSVSQERETLAVSPDGLVRYRARAVVLATGCRELARSALTVAGSRPAGIFNTGPVQRLHTFMHVAPGREAVIVGSDDMSLMATQSLIGQGVRVRAVLEERPYRLGYMGLEWLLLRSRRIPLLLRHKILQIQGAGRVSGLRVTALDATGAPTGKPFEIPCDTLIFSGEFVPENVLTRQSGLALDPHTLGPRVDQNFQTDVRGIFACGNLIHAADAADHAVQDGAETAAAVARYLNAENAEPLLTQEIIAGQGIHAVVPQLLRRYDSRPLSAHLALRVDHAQAVVRVDARAEKQVWGRSFALVAKPHRSIYLDIAAAHPTQAPLIVTAHGRALVPQEFRQTEWRAPTTS